MIMFQRTGKHRLVFWHFSQWSRRKRITVTIILVVVLVAISSGGYAYYTYSHKPKPVASAPRKQETPPPQPKPVPPKYTSPLTGVEVSKELSERPVTAIMIENSPDARPQSGLIDAGVVFEAIAEGGITRFLALYQEAQPALVGPVRSLRLYYVDWLAAFDPSVAHVGGSAKALETVRGGGFKDIDQFFNAGTYWRATDRYAPHNVYTSFERLNALTTAKGYTHSNFKGFDRKPSIPATAPSPTAINVNISGFLYNSSYTYDKASNSYLRKEGGAPHMDRESKRQISPNVVIVIKVNETTVMEDGYRQSIQAIGSGEAFIFEDGAVARGQWHKDSQKEQISFTDEKGAPVKLIPGQTWITAIPTNQSVSWQ